MKRQKETARKARQQEKLLKKQAARTPDGAPAAEGGENPAPPVAGETP
jgi:hypothetical protein